MTNARAAATTDAELSGRSVATDVIAATTAKSVALTVSGAKKRVQAMFVGQAIVCFVRDGRTRRLLITGHGGKWFAGLRPA
jgi:hypothetical protein